MLAVVAATVLLFCGLLGTGAWALVQNWSKDGGGGTTASRSGTSGRAPAAVDRSSGERSTAGTGTGSGKAQNVTVNRTVWYAGLKLTFGEACYDPARQTARLVVDVTIENLAAQSLDNPSITIVYSEDNSHVSGSTEGVSMLPGKASTKGRFEFDLPARGVTLSRGKFVLGDATKVQPVVPLDPKAAGFDSLATRSVLPATAFRIGQLEFAISSCELRVAFEEEHRQIDRDRRGLWCGFTVKGISLESGGKYVGKENFRLKLPDGTVNGPEDMNPPSFAIYPGDGPATGWAEWSVPTPAKGAYVIQFSDLGWLAKDPVTATNTHDVKVTL